jgi:integrase
MSMHFGCLPTELDAEQVQDYLYGLQQRSKTSSQTYFKHTVYGLRFLLKSENLPYEYLHYQIKRSNKLPVILSRQEIWAMMKSAQLLKHSLLIGLLYGCGMHVWKYNLELNIWTSIVRWFISCKASIKDRYVPLSEHLIRGIQSMFLHPKRYLFEEAAIPKTRTLTGGTVSIVYSGLSKLAKQVGILKRSMCICFVIVMPLICWKMVSISSLYKSYWDMRILRLRWFIFMCATTGSVSIVH